MSSNIKVSATFGIHHVKELSD